MLGGALAVLQAPIFDGLSLDPFSLFDDVAGPAEVGVSGRHVLQALVVTLSFPPKTGPLFLETEGGCDGSETSFRRGHT